jgi:hypothetical protein
MSSRDRVFASDLLQASYPSTSSNRLKVLADS